MNPIIKKYLNNQLSEPEEEQLLKDLLKAKFDQEYRQRWNTLLIKEGIQRNQAVEKPLPSQPKLISKLRPLLGLVALLTCFLVLWALFKPANRSNAIASHLQQTKQMAPVVRLGNESVEAQWEKGRQAFQEENYVLAAKHFGASQKEGNANIEQYYYLGLAYLYQNPAKADLAIQNLLKARETNNLRFKKELQWYLGIAYLMQENWLEAKKELQTLVRAKDWKAKEAAQLLNHIPEKFHKK